MTSAELKDNDFGLFEQENFQHEVAWETIQKTWSKTSARLFLSFLFPPSLGIWVNWSDSLKYHSRKERIFELRGILLKFEDKGNWIAVIFESDGLSMIVISNRLKFSELRTVFGTEADNSLQNKGEYW